MADSSIEWTDKTWNPTGGCTVASPGCNHCYAATLAAREMIACYKGLAKRVIKRDGSKSPAVFTGEIRFFPDRLDDPRKWKQPATVFVNSMSDLFHEDVPLEYIQRVFHTMRETPRHTYQVLTKRAERLAELSPQIQWPDNVWMGVSIETNKYVGRADHLRKTAAKTKFLSCEPLIGPLPDLDISGLDWVIAGGESGPGARPMQPEWARAIRDLCKATKTPFFFKQWGAHDATGKRGTKAKNGHLLDGVQIFQMPLPYADRSSSEATYLDLYGIAA